MGFCYDVMGNYSDLIGSCSMWDSKVILQDSVVNSLDFRAEKGWQNGNIQHFDSNILVPANAIVWVIMRHFQKTK